VAVDDHEKLRPQAKPWITVTHLGFSPLGSVDYNSSNEEFDVSKRRVIEGFNVLALRKMEPEDVE
jgi:hypothetical protein